MGTVAVRGVGAADAEEDRVARFAAFTVAIGDALTGDQVAEAVVEGAVAFGASAASFSVPDGTRWRIRRHAGYDAAAVEAYRAFANDADLPLAEAGRTARPVYVATPEALAERWPALAAFAGARSSWAALPVVLEGRVVALIGLSYDAPRAFHAAERRFLETYALLTAHALDRARLYEAERRARAVAEASTRELTGTVRALVETEAHLRSQIDLHETILRAQSDIGEGFALVEGGRVAYANDALCRILGRSREEVLSAADPFGFAHPDEAARVRELHARRIRGEPVEEHYETTVVTSDGRSVRLEMSVKTLALQPVPRLLVIARDVSERARWIEELRREAEFRDAVLRAHADVGVGLVVLNEAGVRYANDAFCALTGWSAEELKDPARAAYVAALLPAPAAPVERREVALVAKDGRLLHLDVAVKSVRDEEGLEHFVVVRDATSEKDGRERLKVYRDIFAAANDAIATIDTEGRYVEQNQAHRALLGYDDRELSGRTPAVHMGDATFARVADALAATGRFRGEVRSRTRDGRELDVELVAFSLKDGDGRVVGHVGIKRDVTARKSAEAALRQRVHELQAVYETTARIARAASFDDVYEAAMDGITAGLGVDRCAVLLYGPDGVMRFKAWRGLSDAYRRAVEGHSPWPRDALDPAPVTIADAATDPSLGALRGIVLAEGVRALAFVPIVHQGRLLGKFMVYRAHAHVFGEDELRLAETLARSVGFGVVRLGAEEEVRRSEGWLRRVLDALDEGVLVESWPDRRIITANEGAVRMFGWSKRELEGAAKETLHVDRAHFEEFGRRAAEAVEAGRTVRFEFRMRRKEGPDFPTENTVTALRDAHGAVLGILSIARDVTDRRRAMEELEAARHQVAMSEKLSAMGTLVSGVAHEIRTPLTYLSNNLFLVERRLRRATPDGVDPAVAEEVLRLLDAAAEGSERINRLVEDLRRFTRVQAQERVRLTLHDAARTAIDLFEATHRGGPRVVRDFGAVLAPAIDPTQVQQIVLNLLDNAADATGVGGTVRVVTRDAEDASEIVVEDDGCGVDASIASRVFDPFYTTKADGTGLGLAIVQRIVEAHGGTVRHEPAGARGARFVVRFPVT